MASVASAEPRLLAGFYNPEKRAIQVNQKLDKELEQFMKLDFTKNVAEQLPDTNNSQKELSLESVGEEIQMLNDEVKSYDFKDGHFTKQYRTFQGACDKLLQQLDSIRPPSGDEEAKKKRGKLIEDVQKIVSRINSKVHEDGKCCPDCELFGTMWQ